MPNSTRWTWTEPDQTRPDISGLWQSLWHVWLLVLAKFHYTGPTRLCRRLSQKNPPRKTRPHRNCYRFFNYTSMQLRVYYWRRKENTLRGWKSTSVRENSMENVTFYYRNLLLQKWWNVSSICEWNGYRSIRWIIAMHGWASYSVKIKNCKNVTNKQVNRH